ncbi:unnamed protein product [Spodoptera littoralis]|uniref:Uncharacterized protein n=1 Tax=Spodoptera littoralis TaxID=7109 RepID=A0A9P0IB59_SPOLI|nr:unnamed protein product [Spodoptera littoralis]
MRPVFVLCMLPVLAAQHALHKEQLPPTLQQVPEKSPYNNSYKDDILISVSMPISKVIDLYGPGIRGTQYQIVNGEDAKIMKITPNKIQRGKL